MTVEEVQNILTAWSENEAILRRRGGESRDWKDPKLFDPYKEERSFVTLVPDRKPYDPYKGFIDIHERDSSNTAGLLRVKPNQEDRTELDPYSPAVTQGVADTHSGGRVPQKADPDYFRHVTGIQVTSTTEDPVNGEELWDFQNNEVRTDEGALSDTVGVQEVQSENILATPIPVPDIPGSRVRKVTFFPVIMSEAKRKPARHINKPTLDQLMDEEWSEEPDES